MKVLKSPFNLIGKIGTLSAVLIIVTGETGIISFKSVALRVFSYIFLGICTGILSYTVESDNKLRKLKIDGNYFEAKTLNMNEVFIGFKIGGIKCCRFDYSYFNDEGETVNGRSRIVYMSINDYMYAKTLRSDELSRIFKVKVYVWKDDKNKYMSEVYKIKD
jgi:hypothetical protein